MLRGKRGTSAGGARRSQLWTLLTLLVAVLALAAAGCGGDDDEGASSTGGSAAEGSIWVLLPDSASSDRWEKDDRRFFEEAFKAEGVEYNIVNAEGDANTQLQQAEQAINAGAKVILLVNLSPESGATIIQNARDADVKVVDYDRLTAAGPGADVYVSFDNVKVGQTMADTVGPVIDELDAPKPKVVMMNGGPTDNNSKLFKEGYNETGDFAVSKKVAAGDWEVAADQDVPDWDNQQALTLFEQILVANDNKVDAVFAANDGIAGSVISALKSANAGPIPVSGQDATASGIQNILAGLQTMTVYKPIEAEAKAAAAAAIALLNGEDVSALTGEWEMLSINNGEADLPYIALGPIAVTKDNVADTVIKDGFRTWEEICTGEFEQYCPANR